MKGNHMLELNGKPLELYPGNVKLYLTGLTQEGEGTRVGTSSPWLE